MDTPTDIQNALLLASDAEYRAFQIKLMPTVDPRSVIGVRTPVIRQMAKELYGTPAADAFVSSLPHIYYEENNLHASLISAEKNENRLFEMLDAFLPFVDNWATCDSMNPSLFVKKVDRNVLLSYALGLLSSDHTYTVRYGVGILMKHFLGENFSPGCFCAVAEIRSDEYYVNMMIAWYFATAFTKRFRETADFLMSSDLSVWVKRKALTKALESRIPDAEEREELRSMRGALADSPERDT